MTTPTTKVAIALRVVALDKQIADKRASLVHQQDERRELAESCRVHGDHVPTGYFTSSTMNAASLAYRCEFCTAHLSASSEQVSRNLNRGPH